MSTNRASVISLFGISAHELRVIQTICLISKSRSHSYLLQADTPNSIADIVIVNQDNPGAMAACTRYQAKHQMTSVIMLTRQPEPDQSVHQLRRPLMATRLLSLLDQILRTQESPAFVAAQMEKKAKAALSEQSRSLRRVSIDVQQKQIDVAAW